MNETRCPLCWPANWKRAAKRAQAQFGKVARDYGSSTGAPVYHAKSRLSMSEAIDRIADELRRLGVAEEHVIISTNVPLSLSGVPRGDRGEPADTGVAIYWTHKGKQQCMAIDTYTRVADNLAAIAATLDDLRSIERHGGGSILERAFLGFAQLPEAIVTRRPWRVVLSIPDDAEVSKDYINQRFREVARIQHPDRNGSHEAMAELNDARARALAEVSA